jgi:VanZ family protein
VQPWRPLAFRSSRSESYFYMALSATLMLGMAAVALLPGNSRKVLHTQGRLHSWWHLFAFTLVGFLAGKISRSPYQRIVLFLTCLAFGFATEYFEHHIYRSPFETHDVWVDAIGVLLGTGTALLFAESDESIL